MKARARWVFERASNAFAHCGRFPRSRRNLTSFSLPSFSWKVFRLGTRGKKIARARARDPNESSDAGENESRRFFSRARIVLRVRAILARVVVVVAVRARLQQISKGERWGRSRRVKNVSHVRSRKNPKNARVASSAPFSCRPSIAQNSYREASSKMVSRANSPSPRKTRRRVNTPTTRGWCLSAPHQICADVVVSFFFVCVLVGFFCLVFRGVDACWPSKQENLPFFCVIILVAAPPKEEIRDSFFLWNLIP